MGGLLYYHFSIGLLVSHVTSRTSLLTNKSHFQCEWKNDGQTFLRMTFKKTGDGRMEEKRCIIQSFGNSMYVLLWTCDACTRSTVNRLVACLCAMLCVMWCIRNQFITNIFNQCYRTCTKQYHLLFFWEKSPMMLISPAAAAVVSSSMCSISKLLPLE